MINTPVLLLIFNRPDVTKIVLERIRQAKPAKLFIAADGPRADKPGEREKCELVRKLVLDGVDWECKVHTLFREENLGCGRAPAEGITWFFNEVEQGIILEDDCVPVLSFFKFCEELLTKYKDDKRIFAISGTNLLDVYNTDYSYFFSVFGGNWGWASWHRAWKHFDFNITGWKQKENKDKIRKFIQHDGLYEYYSMLFDNHEESPVDDVWDYQWLFARLLNEGISIMPSYNQVKNIGFGENATHTFNADSIIARLSCKEISAPLIHPQAIKANYEFDKEVYERYIKEVPRKRNIYRRIKNKIKGIINK